MMQSLAHLVSAKERKIYRKENTSELLATGSHKTEVIATSKTIKSVQIIIALCSMEKGDWININENAKDWLMVSWNILA